MWEGTRVLSDGHMCKMCFMTRSFLFYCFILSGRENAFQSRRYLRRRCFISTVFCISINLPLHHFKSNISLPRIVSHGCTHNTAPCAEGSCVYRHKYGAVLFAPVIYGACDWAHYIYSKAQRRNVWLTASFSLQAAWIRTTQRPRLSPPQKTRMY